MQKTFRKAVLITPFFGAEGTVMTTLAGSLEEVQKKWKWAVIAGGICVVWAAIAIPGLYRSHTELGPVALPRPRYVKAEPLIGGMSQAQAVVEKSQSVNFDSSPAEAAVPRKIIRTSSLDMVVEHPADVLGKITEMAETLGGYLETSNSAGTGGAAATLTVRVPGDRFQQALAEIRKLGLRVDGERVDAQDVTRQYVDQDARIRNLRAEEAQYLSILKQARTVKDMMSVSEQLSEVRGQIEEQQAEFNALSRQVETVSIAISLRTEAQAQTFGLNWRPLYQIQLALHEGLESIANYATLMVGLLFYLPAVLLWVGTIALAVLGSWRIVSWAGRRWFGWKNGEAVAGK